MAKQTYKSVPRPRDKKAIPLKWVYSYNKTLPA